MTQTTTKSGKEFTYVGWLRKYNAADFPGKIALGREYPGYANRRIHEVDKRSNRKPEAVTQAAKEEKAERARFRKMPISELRREYHGTLKEAMGGVFAPAAERAHAMIEAELKRRKASPQPAARKPAARKPGKPPKPRQSRPSAKRPVFGNPPPSVPKKPTGKRFTASQRQQITDALTAQREMERIAKQIRLIEADVNMIQRRGLRGREKEHATATTRLTAARKGMRENLAKQKRALKLLYGKGPGNEAYTYASNKLWTHAREFFG